MAGAVNAPFGMRPVEHWSGSPWNGATRILVAETSNDALFIGDPLQHVVNDATEVSGRYLACDAITGDGTVTAVDDQILGVMVSRAGDSVSAGGGGAPDLEASDTVYIPADTNGALLNAVVDADTVYLAQTNATMVYTDAGKNAEIIVGSGSTVTGLSAFVINGSSAGADASDQLLVLGLWDDPSNLVTDVYSLWLCIVNIAWAIPGGYTAILGTLGI